VQLKGTIVFVTAQQSDVMVKSLTTRRVNSGKTVAVYCAAPAQDIVQLGSDAGAKIAMGVSSAGAIVVGTWPANMSPSSPREH
jgi:hypothetical protein